MWPKDLHELGDHAILGSQSNVRKSRINRLEDRGHLSLPIRRLLYVPTELLHGVSTAEFWICAFMSLRDNDGAWRRRCPHVLEETPGSIGNLRHH
jgi:hypothetical protein